MTDPKSRYEARTDRKTVRLRMTPEELQLLDTLRAPRESRSDCIRRGLVFLALALPRLPRQQTGNPGQPAER